MRDRKRDKLRRWGQDVAFIHLVNDITIGKSACNCQENVFIVNFLRRYYVQFTGNGFVTTSREIIVCRGE